ncbi:MAG: M2 family metallopeptidase, partial [Dokdonella sp.]
MHRQKLVFSIIVALAANSVFAADPIASAKATAADADAFVARVNAEIRKDHPESTAAQWASVTYITDDTALVASKTNERSLSKLNGWLEEAKKFEGLQLSPATARSLHLLKLSTSMPAPRDAEKLAELTKIATKMEGDYGSAKYCSDKDGNKECREIGALSEVLADPKSSYEQQLDAWSGWHSAFKPMRADYQRFSALINEGATEMGFADAGAVWRSGYDMPADDFKAETDRLWDQVKPLYTDLQCYVRGKLVEKYGEKGQVDGKLPAHLTGNLWQQEWTNLWPLVQPYKADGLDVDAALKQQRGAELQRIKAAFRGTPTLAQQFQFERDADLAIAKKMTERAQDFYVSLGMRKLPDSFWTHSQLIKPLDRSVVCHASAWDMNMDGDVRIKMCIEPSGEEFRTIYHELGHLYYDLAYNPQTPIFQGGAHDGFHEAIGDTILLAMTPAYLSSIGMVDKPSQGKEAVINAQMKMALGKVAFLPFGLMIDRWRWGVFDGSITPEHYNQAWWELKAKYQGVAPATPRGEEFFDPGAKYHVPGNTPYT